MKKLLYILPLLLLGLSFTPITLYKDKVDLAILANPNAEIKSLDALLPSHWKSLEYSVSATTSAANSETEDVQATADSSASSHNEPLYESAKFKGFPFAAYFSKDKAYHNGSSTGSLSASGYSWLWASLDAALIVWAFLLAAWVNRMKPKAPVQDIPINNAVVLPGVEQSVGQSQPPLGNDTNNTPGVNV